MCSQADGLRHIANLEMQLRTMEAESRLLAERWQEIERKNAALANLYVAMHQIHGTLVRSEVIEALVEILIGLVGSEALAIYERSGDGARFVLLGSFGVDASDERELNACCDPLGRVLASGARYVAGEPHPLPAADDAGVAVALPLCLGGRVTGGIVLFSLLAQKRGLDDVDYELFELLSHHAALALHCTALLEAEVGA
jgi:uncharacterized coiled-coil protein SlyX